MTKTSRPTLRAYASSDWENFLALDLETSRPAVGGGSVATFDRFATRWPEYLRSRYAWDDSGPKLDASLLQICEVDEQFAGHLWLTEQTDFFSEERKLFITTIAVAKAYRNQGIGRFLMQAALAEARNRGLARISLGVDASNSSAIALYGSMGFEAKRLSLELETGLVSGKNP